MSSDRTQQFIQAYRNLTLSPLLRDEEIADFWVSAYGEKVLTRLRQSVLLAGDNGRIWFSGQRGCGKSTLIGQLAKQLRQEGLYVVGFSMADMVEMSDVSHISILYAIALRLLESTQRQNVSLPSNISAKLTAWFAHTGEALYDEQLSEGSVARSGMLDVIKRKLKGEHAFREQIAQKYAFRTDELVQQIDLIAAAIQVATNQPVVVMVDDLNKLYFKDFEAIFREHAKALWGPNIRLVFVVPVATAKDFAAGTWSYFDSAQVTMGVVQLFARAQVRAAEAVPIEENVALLAAVLQRRLPETLIEPEILREMVLMSGGVLRDLMRLAKECCQECLLRLEESQQQNIQIDLEILQAAAHTLRLDMARALGSELYDLLSTIHRELRPPDARSEDFQMLLNGLYVLEYGEGEEIWYDVHPLVKNLLRQKALTD